MKMKHHEMHSICHVEGFVALALLSLLDGGVGA